MQAVEMAMAWLNSRAHHAVSRYRRFPVVVEEGPELAGLWYDRLVSETADPWFGGRIGAFFSGQEIPFAGNGDRSWQRLGSKGQLLGRKPERLVLAGPFGRQIGEADNSHAMRKASFDRSLDKVGREEGKRDCHIDLADAAIQGPPPCGGARPRRSAGR